MAGKPKIPADVTRTIHRLDKQGLNRREIAERIECSRWTVRKALDPDFAERERERQRRLWPERKPKRQADEGYRAYQAEYSSRPEYLEKVRLSMAARRQARKSS